MVLKFVVLLAALVGFVSATPFSLSFSAAGDDLHALCKGKTTDLTKISHIKSLVEKINGYESKILRIVNSLVFVTNAQQPNGDDENKLECSERIVSALKGLKSVIDGGKDDECSPDSVASYKQYYMEFLDTSTEEKKKNKLPSSLRTFALAYGMELSRLCRVNMVKVLVQNVPDLLAERDFKRVERFVGEGKAIDTLFALSATKPDDFILPSDFYGPEMRDRKVVLNKKTVPELKKLQTICRRRFKPVYDKVLMPVVRLGHMGFSSRDGELKKMYGDSNGLKDASKTVKMWSRIMFLCEGLENVVLKQSDEERARSGKDGELQIVEVSKQASGTEPGADEPKSSAPESAVNGAASSNGEEKHESLEDTKDAHHESGGLKHDHDVLGDVKDKHCAIEEVAFEQKLTVEVPDQLVRPMDLKQRASLIMINTSINEQAKQKVTLKYKALQKVAGYLTKVHMGPYFSGLSKKFKESMEFLNRINGEGVRAWGPHMTNEEGVAKELLGALETAVENELAADGPVGDDDDILGCCCELCCSACCELCNDDCCPSCDACCPSCEGDSCNPFSCCFCCCCGDSSSSGGGGGTGGDVVNNYGYYDFSTNRYGQRDTLDSRGTRRGGYTESRPATYMPSHRQGPRFPERYQGHRHDSESDSEEHGAHSSGRERERRVKRATFEIESGGGSGGGGSALAICCADSATRTWAVIAATFIVALIIAIGIAALTGGLG